MKRLQEQLKELQARIPKEPDHIVVTWNPDSGTPKPEAPPGYQGVFIIVRSYIVETGAYVDQEPSSYERQNNHIGPSQ